MTFLSMGMIGAFAAVAVPLLIHFLFKRRYHKYAFGAMTVIRMALARRRERILAEQIIVIGTRCLALALLAVALLKPIWGQSRSGSAAGPACMVLLMDTSYSMLAGQGLSRFERARQVARNLTDSAGPDDEVYVISATQDIAEIRRAAPFAGGDDAKAALDALTVSWRPRHLPSAVREAAGLLRRSSLPRRQLFIFTDPQALGLAAGDAARWEAVAREVNRIQPRPQVHWVEPGLTEKWHERSDNLVIDPPSCASPVVHTGEPTAFFVSVRNFSDEPVPQVDVKMTVDGKVRGRGTTAVGARQSAVLRFSHVFEKAGPHQLTFDAWTERDLLEEDNQARLAVFAEPSVRVLVIDGSRTPEPLRNEADMVQLALSPLPLEDNKNSPYRVEVIHPLDLYRQGVSLREYDAVFFLNVRDPDEDLINGLERYVSGGGGLLLALGDRCAPEYYNDVLHRNGFGLLPCRLLAKAGDEKNEEMFETPQIAKEGDPCLAPLGANGHAREADFRHVRVRSWYRVKSPAALAQTREVLSLSPSGEPLLLARPFGRGRLYVMTAPLNISWTDLPLHPVFPAWVRGLADTMRNTRVPPLNVLVGEPLEAIFPARDRGGAYTVTAPDMIPVRQTVRRRGGGDWIRFEDTHRPGFYQLAQKRPGSLVTRTFAVNPDTAESDLTPAPLADRTEVARLLGARRVGGWSALAPLMKRARRGVPVWMLFLALTAVFVLLEVFFARLFTRSFIDESKLTGDIHGTR